MLPYLAFAGPATVMMALLNAQGRFRVDGVRPRCCSTSRLIVVMVALFGWRGDASSAALAIAATVGLRRGWCSC